MSLIIFAGDFKSGRAGPNGFHLESRNGTGNLAEFVPLSHVQTLERFNDIKEAIDREAWVSNAGLDLDAIAKLNEDAKTHALFVVCFKDSRKMIGSADINTWNQLGQSGTTAPDERLENSHFSAILESGGSFEGFERIDWATAAPSWASIVGGVIFPLTVVVALIFFIYVTVSWVFEYWVGHFWTVPFWLFATMAVPLTLVGAFLAIATARWVRI
jgi:hypothetical protein